MNEVELAMTSTMKDKLNQAVLTYKNIKRNSWILNNPGQCVLNGSQIHWTTQAEESINQKGLKNFLNFLELQLQDLVTIDRSSLHANHLVTIEALIVIDVHAKDVIEGLYK